ncbi:nucleotide exchange factor GrpE [Glycomyces terrestris]|uniref:hypothetical protein n=1 Tax=Glycomyces terrestris TaxID=2493553 RepID=UPI0013157A04|nr:hypothetical protein [Glycomyces terrestris]
MMRDLLRLPGRGGRRSRRRRELTAQIAYRVAELYGVGDGREDLSARRIDEVAELEFALAVLDGLAPVEAEAERAAPPPGQGPPEIVLKLVRVHDRLDMAADRDAESAPLVKRFRNDVLELLAVSGADLVERDGPLQPPLHEVLSTVPTADPALVHHVARTVRPGVRWNGRLIRPQQVVAYVEEGR